MTDVNLTNKTLLIDIKRLHQIFRQDLKYVLGKYKSDICAGT